MGRGFKDSGGKFRPTNKSTRTLSSGQLDLRSPNKPLLEAVRQQNIDPEGNFTQNSKKIPLETISIFNKKNKTFILKGTNPSNEKTVTKIVKLN